MDEKGSAVPPKRSYSVSEDSRLDVLMRRVDDKVADRKDGGKGSDMTAEKCRPEPGSFEKLVPIPLRLVNSHPPQLIRRGKPYAT